MNQNMCPLSPGLNILHVIVKQIAKLGVAPNFIRHETHHITVLKGISKILFRALSLFRTNINVISTSSYESVCNLFLLGSQSRWTRPRGPKTLFSATCQKLKKKTLSTRRTNKIQTLFGS